MKLFRPKRDTDGHQSHRAATLLPKPPLHSRDYRHTADRTSGGQQAGALSRLRSIEEDNVLCDTCDDTTSVSSSAVLQGGSSFQSEAGSSSNSFSFSQQEQESFRPEGRGRSQATENARWGEIYEDDDEDSDTTSSWSLDDTSSTIDKALSGLATLSSRPSRYPALAHGANLKRPSPDSPNSVLELPDRLPQCSPALPHGSLPHRAVASEPAKLASQEGSPAPGTASANSSCRQPEQVAGCRSIKADTRPAADGAQAQPAAREVSTEARPYDGKGEGVGVCTFANGDEYVGSLLDGVPHGVGLYHFSSKGRYAGYWHQGSFSGPGMETFADGAIHVGSYSEGLATGYGICLYNDGSFYEGQFKAGLPHGRGMHKAVDGSSYVGHYSKGQRNGHGAYLFGNGDRYLGTWRTDVPAGLGCYHSARGGFYEGEFEEGMKDGWGVNTTANGRQFVGRWSEGTTIWQELYDPDSPFGRRMSSQVFRQRAHTALSAAARGRDAAAQGLQLVVSHIADTRAPAKQSVLQGQEAAAAAEKLQDVAIAAAEGYRRITGATDIAKRSNPDCRDQDGVSEAVHKLLRQVSLNNIAARAPSGAPAGPGPTLCLSRTESCSSSSNSDMRQPDTPCSGALQVDTLWDRRSSNQSSSTMSQGQPSPLNTSFTSTSAAQSSSSDPLHSNHSDKPVME